MNKIEEYTRLKSIAGHLKKDYLCASGLELENGVEKDNPNNDKASITCRFVGRRNADWSDMIFDFHMSHGYYGSSSGYSDTSNEMGYYLAKVITKHGQKLLKEAVELAEQDAEKARLDAKQEAEMVLQRV